MELDRCPPKLFEAIENISNLLQFVKEVRVYRADDDRTIRIGADLEPADKTQLKKLITQYKDIFAWSPADMPRIDISMSCHRLSVDKNVKPIR